MSTAAGTLLILAAKAESTDKKHIAIKAYSGSTMRVSDWGLVAIELTGLELPETVPLLAAHREGTRDVVGQGRPVVRDGTLFVEGDLLLVTPVAKELHALAAAGFLWSASVGIETIASSYVAAGDERRVNGKMLKSSSGYTLITRGALREVSLLPTGADSKTQVKIAASGRARERKDPMSETKLETEKVGDPVEQRRLEAAAEEERIAGIQKVCGSRHADICARAIGDGWPVMQAELEVLRADRPKPPSIAASQPSGASSEDVLAAAFLQFYGHQDVAEKAYGERVLDEAHGLRARSLVDLCAECLRVEGRNIPRTASGVIRAAFSTNALSVALGSTAEKLILEGYADAPPSWKGFVNVVAVKDFKTAKVIRPTFAGELQQIPDTGEFKHGLLTEETVDVQAQVYGQVLSVGYKSMVNDDGGVFESTAIALGKNAMRKVADIVYESILGNAGSFFSAGHSNLLEGVDSALSASALGTAIAAMISQRDESGRDLDIRPVVLVVPPELRETGLMLVESELVARYVSETLDKLPTGNPFQGLALAVEPRLSNSVRFTGTSATAWYLFASPRDAAVNLAFVNGEENPQIETFGPSDQVERLAFTWRVYHSFGVGLGDYRAALKATGEA